MSAIIDYRGKTPTKTSYGVPLVTAKVIKDGRIETPHEFIAECDYEAWMRRGLPVSGDVLITTEAPLGEVAQIGDSKVALAQRVILLRGKAELLDNDYLKYLMQSDEVQSELRSRATGTTVLGIRQSELRKVTLTVPPIPEQRRIAKILRDLDDKIELNRKMNETLESMARALFKSWFVDFDPVRAKMEGSQPEGMDAETAALFPDRLVESDLGMIPEGWEVGTIGDLTALNPESWTKHSRPSVIKYVDLSCTKWGRIQSVTKYAETDSPSRAQRVLRMGDTIVGTVRPGNGSYALVSEDNLTGSTGFAVLRPVSRQYIEYVYLAATAHDNIQALAHIADGGAYPAIHPEAVAATQVAIPHDKRVLDSFCTATHALLDMIAENDRESCTIAFLRNLLLPVLMSGHEVYSVAY